MTTPGVILLQNIKSLTKLIIVVTFALLEITETTGKLMYLLLKLNLNGYILGRSLSLVSSQHETAVFFANGVPLSMFCGLFRACPLFVSFG